MNIDPKRGVLTCRGCISSELFSAFDMGFVPIANELLTKTSERHELFPLHLRVCTNCGLGQVGEPISPLRLFEDYRYRSSMSSTFDNHIKNFVGNVIDSFAIQPNELVIEIASNDGYLLKYFLPHGQNIIGIEPSKNISHIAMNLGIPTICDFFSSDLAKSIILEYGHPKLVIANNVMAHVPDLQDFIAALRILAGPETIISIENPSMLNLFKSRQFDSIYHEHYSYFSIFSVNNIVAKHNLRLVDVIPLAIHGGSNRYIIQLNHKNYALSPDIKTQIAFEQESGIFSPENWVTFTKDIENLILDFRSIFLENEHQEKVIIGYGAAAKASTFINMSKISSKNLTAIVDTNPEKIGRFMPSANIPIISEDQGVALNPTDLIIFPWNIQEELFTRARSLFGDRIRIWSTVPKVRIL